ncbi:MAG TPA: hypothetical protein DD643_03775 [Synechococcus sp. UBA8638]|nr:hypothetical protein [Synechococcus sp. UBA8638]
MDHISTQLNQKIDKDLKELVAKVEGSANQLDVGLQAKMDKVAIGLDQTVNHHVLALTNKLDNTSTQLMHNVATQLENRIGSLKAELQGELNSLITKFDLSDKKEIIARLDTLKERLESRTNELQRGIDELKEPPQQPESPTAKL